VRIGCRCQGEVGQCKKRSALGAISGIEMCFRNHQTGFAVSFFYFYQFYTCFIGKTVFLEKFLRRHVVW
jgi:hypothetical protein